MEGREAIRLPYPSDIVFYTLYHFFFLLFASSLEKE